MNINKHLMKEFPRYTLISQTYSVKLLKVYKTDNGLMFTAEILDGEHKGKWTTVSKGDLEKR